MTLTSFIPQHLFKAKMVCKVIARKLADCSEKTNPLTSSECCKCVIPLSLILQRTYSIFGRLWNYRPAEETALSSANCNLFLNCEKFKILYRSSTEWSHTNPLHDFPSLSYPVHRTQVPVTHPESQHIFQHSKNQRRLLLTFLKQWSVPFFQDNKTAVSKAFSLEHPWTHGSAPGAGRYLLFQNAFFPGFKF